MASSPESGAEFSPEAGYLIPAFKRALEDMKKGELVDLIIKPECMSLHMLHRAYLCQDSRHLGPTEALKIRPRFFL